MAGVPAAVAELAVKDKGDPIGSADVSASVVAAPPVAADSSSSSPPQATTTTDATTARMSAPNNLVKRFLVITGLPQSRHQRHAPEPHGLGDTHCSGNQSRPPGRPKGDESERDGNRRGERVRRNSATRGDIRLHDRPERVAPGLPGQILETQTTAASRRGCV